MRATVQTFHRGNTAIQSEKWVIPVPLAKKAMEVLDCHVGSYWHGTLAKPTRRAIRAKQGTVTVYTGGFTTCELAQVLAGQYDSLPDGR